MGNKVPFFVFYTRFGIVDGPASPDATALYGHQSRAYGFQIVELEIDIYQTRIFRKPQKHGPKRCGIDKCGQHATMNNPEWLQMALLGVKFHHSLVHRNRNQLHSKVFRIGAGVHHVYQFVDIIIVWLLH